MGSVQYPLTAQEAEARYALDASATDEWFGIVRLDEGAERPNAYLQMCPRANGVTLHTLNRSGSIDASYAWSQPEPSRLFLGQITWYAYPDDDTFYRRGSALGHVTMQFRPDGYSKEDRVTKRGFNEPSDVETREFAGVDVSANWFDAPKFGEWQPFFEPEPSE